MKQLLLVYHQPVFCRAFGEAIAKKSDNVMISFVTDAKTALKHLALRPCDVMLTDSRLPVVDGLQLLVRVQQRFPYIIRAVMATHADEAERQKAMESGAIMYFEKPASPEGYDAAANRVIDILKSIPEAPRGELDPAELNHAISQQVSTGKSLTVNIFMGFDRGMLVFERHKLIHAQTQGLKGKEALREIISWHDGVYEIRGETPTSPRTLDMTWDEVFSDWKKGLKQRPSVNTTVVNREFKTFVTGETPSKPSEPVEKEKKPEPSFSRASRVAPKLKFSEQLKEQTGAACGLQMDAQGNIEQEFHCPDPTLMRGVASFTIAKGRELAGAFQWEMPLSVHYVSPSMNLVILPYKEKTVLLGWPSRQEGVLEKINHTFGEEFLDPVGDAKHPIEPTMDAMKKTPGLHGYAIFRKPLQLLVKKFSSDWKFEMLETTARIASQMCTVLRLQGMPLDLIDVKFKVGSVLAKPSSALTLIVISHSQTKVPLLKDCMLKMSPGELSKAAR